MQVRFALPAWLGVGVALKDQIDQGNLAMLQDMYYNWPFFQSTIDLVEMVMAKSDLRIAKVYDDKLITDPDLKVRVVPCGPACWALTG
jgi:phosphoenolpyruvate carboxylase